MVYGESKARQRSKTTMRHQFLLIWKIIESIKRPSRMLQRNWKFVWNWLCPVRWRQSAQGSHSKLERVRAQTPTRNQSMLVVVGALEFTRKPSESTVPRKFEDHDSEKGFNSINHKRDKESPLCYIDGHLSSPECRVGTELPKIQRTSRAPR